MTAPPFDPAANGWSVRRSDVFIAAIGPAWGRDGGPSGEIGMVANPGHDNGSGIMHGGALMAFIDHALGLAVVGDSGGIGVTIQLDVQFVAAIPLGAFVTAAPEVTRRTRSVVFVRGTFAVDGTTVATANGLWRLYPAAT